MKKKDGITLIALVITIIVLLILAGITISFVLGDNGIIAKARKASIVTRRASVIEKLNEYKTEKRTSEEFGDEYNIRKRRRYNQEVKR